MRHPTSLIGKYLKKKKNLNLENSSNLLFGEMAKNFHQNPNAKIVTLQKSSSTSIMVNYSPR
jgi:hypothetical protein